MRPALFLAAAALAACAEATATAPGPIAGEQALAFLTEGPFACRQDDERWKAMFQADGGYGYQYKGETFVGRWRFDNEGRICTIDDGSFGEQCFGQTRRGASLILTRESGESFECRRARSL
jgi:hypothetical protein